MDQKVERGLYRHFKGKLYFVHGVVLKVEDMEEEYVLYEALYGEPGRQFVRSVGNFTEQVSRPEIGYEGPRFCREPG